MTDLTWLTNRPIAHRGLHDEADGRPENSLPAFDFAAAKNIPFEFDVQLTRDGHPVVLHDADIRRVTGRPGRVQDLDWDAVAPLRIGHGQSIPTLDQVLELVAGRVPVVVDVRRWAFGGTPELERAVADRLRGYPGAAVLQSFDPIALRRLSRLAPDRPIGQASGSLRTAGPLRRIVGRMMLTNAIVRPDFLTYELDLLPSRFVTYWRGAGRPLLAYSVHDDAEEERALRLADGFFFAGYLPRAYR